MSKMWFASKCGNSRKQRGHKTLVMQIVQNMITRGLIYTVTDATIATTECIVLSHNIKRLTLQHHDSVKESK